MGRPYLRVSEYAFIHDIPKRTLYQWIRDGIIEAKTGQFPILIPDDQPVPRKIPDIHKWRYQKTEK